MSWNALLKVVLTLTIVLTLIQSVNAEPTGVEIMFNETETPTFASAAELTTAGGTFTTLVLNGTFQNPRWKAYVGNVTGALTLADGAGSSIYDWALAFVSGQVYVSRNDTIQWSTVACASLASIDDEESYLNKNSSSVDSIRNTFNQTIHRSFFVGTNEISSNSCRSIVTNVNDESQELSENAFFQEVLLEDDKGDIIYTTMLEDAITGYDGSLFDFQLIVPEDSSNPTPTTYYFYAELN